MPAKQAFFFNYNTSYDPAGWYNQNNLIWNPNRNYIVVEGDTNQAKRDSIDQHITIPGNGYLNAEYQNLLAFCNQDNKTAIVHIGTHCGAGPNFLFDYGRIDHLCYGQNPNEQNGIIATIKEKSAHCKEAHLILNSCHSDLQLKGAVCAAMYNDQVGGANHANAIFIYTWDNIMTTTLMNLVSHNPNGFRYNNVGQALRGDGVWNGQGGNSRFKKYSCDVNGLHQNRLLKDDGDPVGDTVDQVEELLFLFPPLDINGVDSHVDL